jgi:hypothetical protein
MKFAPLLTLLLGTLAFAQLPPAEQIDRDLAGPFATTQAAPAHARRGEVCRRVEKLLIQQARYLGSTLHPWPQNPQARLLTDGKSDEHNIRPNTHTAFGLAVLARCLPDDAFPPEFTRQQAHDDAIAILRFALATHGAGGQRCTDGKQWHNQWQSALWAYSAGQAAWLLWDDLTPEMKWLAARMTCDEADRFIDLRPPMQIVSDTKAEENAWNSQVISLAYNMFPRHPHHERWRDAAIRWIINSFPTEADRTRDDVIDGRPLSAWLVGANVYDDYTLENHDRVHPDYMSTTKMLVFLRLNYAWAGNAPPAALDFNVEPIYQRCKWLTFPDGGFFYPNAQDWQLHRNADWFDDHCCMAVVYHDAQAARLMRIVLDTSEKMAARTAPAGPIVQPHETIFASTNQFIFEGDARAYLLMAALGEGPEPVSEEQLWHDLNGVHLFKYGMFGVRRSKNAVASFSWGRQVMGLVVPMDRDLLLSPNDRSMVGMVTVDGVSDRAAVRRVETPRIENALAVVGILDRGRVSKAAATTTQPRRIVNTPPIAEQRFGFLSLQDGTTVYVDTFALTGDAKPSSIDLGTLGVLNDRDWVYHDGTRTLHADTGETTFAAADAATRPPVKLDAKWLNLDDKLGIVCLSSSGQSYTPTPTTGRAGAGRFEQLLQLNVLSKGAIASAKPGDVLARTALVFFPTQSAAETKRLAERCRAEWTDARHVGIELPERRHVAIDLDQLTMTLAPR